MIEREYYSLVSLAERWACTFHDLLHLGMQGRAQVCVNIYSMASCISRTRIEADALNFSHDDELLTDEEQCEAEAHEEASDYWRNGITQDMPFGVFELEHEDLRCLEMPDAFPFELFAALKFDGGWWSCEFDPPVLITPEHLCMLHKEVLRVNCEVFENDVLKNQTPALVSRREKATTHHDNNIIKALTARGIDPMNMPSAPLGNKPWPLREEIAKELRISATTARKAFTRLRKDKRMKSAE